jgi:chaperonin GroES
MGGIIIPDTAKEKPQEGEVIAVGPVPVTRPASSGARRQGWRPRAVRQVVRHRSQDDGEDLLIMKESDIMGVLGKKPKHSA